MECILFKRDASHDEMELKMMQEPYKKIFEEILTELNSDFIGQEVYFETLCQYFLDKIERDTYGSILLVGEPNTFKKNGVKSVFTHMHESELRGAFELSELDMGNYDFSLGYNVFLTDLMKVLQSEAKGVIFKNMELASEQMNTVLSVVKPSATIHLENPYAVRDMFLVEIDKEEQHNRDETTIETIDCPEKFYIFSFNRRPNDDLEAFLENNLLQREAVFYTRDLTRDEKLAMMQRILFKVLKEIEETHQIKIMFNPDGQEDDAPIKRLYQYIASFEEHENFTLMEYTRHKIGDPLDKLLQEKKDHKETVYLYVAHNELYCRMDEAPNRLKDYTTPSLSELKYRLQKQTGLKAFKTFMKQIENNYKVQGLRKQMGLKTISVNLNTVFTGNAGTGKSASAVVMHDYLLALNVIEKECFISASQSDFMTDDLPKLRDNINELFERAKGGVLFIDEVASIFNKEDSAVSEAFITALNEGYKRYGNSMVIIISGKDEKMLSRIPEYILMDVFPNRVHFADYTPSEMYTIAVSYAKQNGYTIEESLKHPLIDLFDQTQIKEKKGLGNARFVRNVIDRAISESRKSYLYNPNQAMDTLLEQHFNFNVSINFDLESRLSEIIGLDDVKNVMRSQYKLLIAQEKRRSVGVHTEIEQNLNMVFAGNPGTGKTSIARLVAEMLRTMGFLKKGQLIETCLVRQPKRQS
jgi:Cdc6-like AAA superfamily ATPase